MKVKTVLINSAWEYVELWLRRQGSSRLLKMFFFWKQAKSFFNASENLPIESKPLTSYYCCMNAAKSLLAICGEDSIDFDNMSHGISSDRCQWKTNHIKDGEVIFTGGGVLFELSKHVGEVAKKKIYSVYGLLYNIPYISM